MSRRGNRLDYAATESCFSPVKPDLGEAFIAMQLVRTPSARSWFDKGYNAVTMAMLEVRTRTWDMFLISARKIMPDASDVDLKETFDEVRDFLGQPGARVKMDQTTLIRSAFELAPDIEDELMNRCWLLGIAPDDAPLATSDDPIVLDRDGDGESPVSGNWPSR